MVYIAKNQNFGLITGLMLFLQNPYIGKKKKKKKINIPYNGKHLGFFVIIPRWSK